MLKNYILYKNQRNRFISLELEDDKHSYNAYIISRHGYHRYIGNVNSSNISFYVDTLKLVKASDTEHALNALYRINDDLDTSYTEEEDG